MRQIKFRIWDQHKRIMSYDDNWIYNDGTIYESSETKFNTPNIEIESCYDSTQCNILD